MNQRLRRRLEELERITAQRESAKRKPVSLDAFYARVEAAMLEENFQKDPRESWMESYTRFMGIPYREFVDELKAGVLRAEAAHDQLAYRRARRYEAMAENKRTTGFRGPTLQAAGVARDSGDCRRLGLGPLFISDEQGDTHQPFALPVLLLLHCLHEGPKQIDGPAQASHLLVAGENWAQDVVE